MEPKSFALPRTFITLALCVILALALGVRKYSWDKKGGLFRRDGTSCIDGYMDAAKQLSKNEWKEILNYRPTQLLYPVLLSPIFRFQLSEDRYVFWLHSSFALLAVFFCLLIGSELLSPVYGLVTALFSAVFPLLLSWFTWATTEIMYYALLTGTLYAFLRSWRKQGAYFPLVLASLLLVFTKIDTLPFCYTIWSILFLKHFAAAYSKKAAYTIWASSSVMGLIVVIATLTFSTTIQEKLKTHFHTAVGLWVSTHTSHNGNAIEHNNAIALLSNTHPCGNGADSEMCQRRFMVKTGLDIIKGDPLLFLKNAWLRFTALLCPSIYDTAWTTGYRLTHFTLTLFAVMGAFLTVFFSQGTKKTQYKWVLLLAFSTLLIASFYEADAENRFRIPSQLIMGLLAPYGWWLLLKALVPETLWDKFEVGTNSLIKSSEGHAL